MKRTAAKVAWADACVPKCEGGLGIPDIFTCNKANMAKHLWDLARKKDSHWVKWCHMFMIKDKCLWGCRCPSNASWTWLKITKLRDSFHDVIRYKVGTGENIFVRFDSWHPLGPLAKRFGQRIISDCASSKWAK